LIKQRKKESRERERERKREKNDANSVTASAHRETRHKSCSRSIGMAASAKSGWRRHVACDDERREERWSVVVTSSQKEGARERQQ
jgi:hypothetical protein